MSGERAGVKLSMAQQRVVDRIREGWELGKSTSMLSGRAWLQRDGLGRGGPVEKVTVRTLNALLKRGLIRTGGYSFPTQRYTLAISMTEAAGE